MGERGSAGRRIEDASRSRDRRGALPPASRTVRCFWCDRLHRGEHALAVCGPCRASYATLRSLGMRGSYALEVEAIERTLTRTSPGNFALGYMDGDAFTVFYVGRSDSDVKRCLHDWVGTPSHSDRYGSANKAAWGTRGRYPNPLDAPAFGRVGAAADDGYTRFAFSYASTAGAAYEKECRNYDDFGGRFALDNECPPAWAPRILGTDRERSLQVRAS